MSGAKIVPANLTSQGVRLLRQWLQEEDLTLTLAAKQLGCSRPLVGQWLQGRGRPSLRFILAIQLVTDGQIVPHHWLLATEIEMVAAVAEKCG